MFLVRSRGALLFLCGWMLAACARPPHPAASASAQSLASAPPIIDAMPDFWVFWEKAEGADATTQKKLFKQLVVARRPELYQAKVIGLDASQPYEQALDARLDKYLPLLLPHVAELRRVAGALPQLLREAIVDFRRTFPDFALREPIYELCSIGGFDGGTRSIQGREVLAFGPDVMAIIRPPGFNHRAFIEHELFHVYHRTWHPKEPDAIWWYLWSEGLATYVSHFLNPRATQDELSLPEDLIAKATPRLPELARTLLDHLEEGEDSSWYGYFFLGPLDRQDVPARSGYLIGYRVAAQLARRHDLTALTHLEGESLQREIRAELLRIRDGAPAL